MFKFLQCEERFRKATFSWRISLDGQGLIREIGNLSTDDGDARDDAEQKMDLNFTLECRK